MKNLLLSLRPKHWIKNLFIFLPLIFGKKLFIFPTNLLSVAAFLIFSIAASAVYLINDIIDFDSDKCHPIKKQRPIASGKINRKQAIIEACILGILSVACSFILNIHFGLIVVVYFVFSFLYSTIFKKVVIIDVFCLGGFFLLRIIAGSVVLGLVMSHWIIIMTILLALFLGFNKRRQELKLNKAAVTIHHRQVLIEYNAYFIDQMISIITSSIVISYMLYAVDERTVREFTNRNLIYTIPFVYYGIFRYLYLIHKLCVDGDPVSILLADRKIQLNLVLWISVCIAVIYFHL